MTDEISFDAKKFQSPSFICFRGLDKNQELVTLFELFKNGDFKWHPEIDKLIDLYDEPDSKPILMTFYKYMRGAE